MSFETSYLKLIKPLAGSTNWGAVMNNNFDKIDNAYSVLNSTLDSVEARMTEQGIFKFLKKGTVTSWGGTLLVNLIFARCHPDAKGITIGHVSESKFHEYSNFRHNPNSEQHSLESLGHNTAFYIIEDGQLKSTTSSTETDKIDVKAGDLIVLVREVSENLSYTRINVMSQATGYTYTLSQTNITGAPNEIVATKTVNALAPDTINLNIPTALVHTTKVTKTCDTNTTIDTGYSVGNVTINGVKAQYDIIDIRFYLSDGQRALVDYTFDKPESGNYQIIFNENFKNKGNCVFYVATHYV